MLEADRTANAHHALRIAIADARIMAVVSIDHEPDAVPLLNALVAGGVRVIEVALRTPAALSALAAMKQLAPEILVGAGTVITLRQADAAKAAGASFALAPGFDAETVRYCAEIDLPFVPGIATATDIQHAVGLGCTLLKVFPAEALGGVTGLRTLSAPFAHLQLRYVALGGIHATNLPGYLAEECVAAVGGSWMAPPDLIRQRAWNEIQTRTAAAVALAEISRPVGERRASL